MSIRPTFLSSSLAVQNLDSIILPGPKTIFSSETHRKTVNHSFSMDFAYIWGWFTYL